METPVRHFEYNGKKLKGIDLGSVKNISKLPYSIRILLENVLRNKDGVAVTDEHVSTLLNWTPEASESNISFKPARVLMQDFTGVPSIVDIASLRAEFIRKGKDGKKINPSIPVDLIVDHSVQVDYFENSEAYQKNVAKEYERNHERYSLLKWAQNAFSNFKVVPPGMGICHQINLEYLAQGIVERDGWLFPDTLVGTDSHTPMVNGIGVVGWGVGGIEAEAAMLDQPLYMACPEVIGLELTGKLPEGTTSTDLVLTITKLLRDYGVVGKFVEVIGKGLDHLSIPDRATISNMSPEFGCTITYFPIDDRTLEYMKQTNRPKDVIDRVEKYTKENYLWRNDDENISYTDIVCLDLSSVEPTVSGPKRPQDKILVKDLKNQFKKLLKADGPIPKAKSVTYNNKSFELDNGNIVIAAITSCTNTSNPSVMIGAGLVAKRAVEKGLQTKPWVKTSLAPGSKVVTNYLERSGLDKYLEALNFYTVGYGCTTCIGNSGPLPPEIDNAVVENNLNVSAVLSGNRNFEARIHPKVKMNFLASPMLVVAYAIAGTVEIDLINEPLGSDKSGAPVYLKDIWPDSNEIQKVVSETVKKKDFDETYKVIFDGEDQWKNLEVPTGDNYAWSDSSTYIKEAPFFKDLNTDLDPVEDIKNARVLLKLGDSVTTDHISPAGAFAINSPAGSYLKDCGVEVKSFNSYGSRRGNHEVMLRGTFANVRIKNQLATQEGGFTKYFPEEKEMSVYEASQAYQKDKTDLIIIAGKEYGSGSSRDWAAKGTSLLGVKAVIAESFERIHRSNLVGMGVLPLQFKDGESADQIGLKGDEVFSIIGLGDGLKPHQTFKVTAGEKSFEVISRLDSIIEIEYYKNKGILQYVLRSYLKEA